MTALYDSSLHYAQCLASDSLQKEEHPRSNAIETPVPGWMTNITHPYLQRFLAYLSMWVIPMGGGLLPKHTITAAKTIIGSTDSAESTSMQ